MRLVITNEPTQREAAIAYSLKEGQSVEFPQWGLKITNVGGKTMYIEPAEPLRDPL